MREISIEEMPQGCVLTSDKGKTIVISLPEDVSAIIESLKKLQAAQQSVQQTGLRAVSQNGIYSDNPNDDEGDK